MPEMDGIQFLASLKNRSSSPPVIVITADIQEESKKQCMVLGAKAFINKPFKNSDLEVAIDGCLKN
jgi:twitching motility two-component system response regulator PilH